MADADDLIEPGLLYGLPAIADFLRVRTRQADHMMRSGGLPTFKIAGKVCARRATLTAWLTEREAAARRPAGGPGRPRA